MFRSSSEGSPHLELPRQTTPESKQQEQETDLVSQIEEGVRRIRGIEQKLLRPLLQKRIALAEQYKQQHPNAPVPKNIPSAEALDKRIRLFHQTAEQEKQRVRELIPSLRNDKERLALLRRKFDEEDQLLLGVSDNGEETAEDLDHADIELLNELDKNSFDETGGPLEDSAQALYEETRYRHTPEKPQGWSAKDVPPDTYNTMVALLDQRQTLQEYLKNPKLTEGQRKGIWETSIKKIKREFKSAYASLSEKGQILIGRHFGVDTLFRLFEITLPEEQVFHEEERAHEISPEHWNTADVPLDVYMRLIPLMEHISDYRLFLNDPVSATKGQREEARHGLAELQRQFFKVYSTLSPKEQYLVAEYFGSTNLTDSRTLDLRVPSVEEVQKSIAAQWKNQKQTAEKNEGMGFEEWYAEHVARERYADFLDLHTPDFHYIHMVPSVAKEERRRFYATGKHRSVKIPGEKLRMEKDPLRLVAMMIEEDLMKQAPLVSRTWHTTFFGSPYNKERAASARRINEQRQRLAQIQAQKSRKDATMRYERNVPIAPWIKVIYERSLEKLERDLAEAHTQEERIGINKKIFGLRDRMEDAESNAGVMDTYGRRSSRDVPYSVSSKYYGSTESNGLLDRPPSPPKTRDEWNRIHEFFSYNTKWLAMKQQYLKNMGRWGSRNQRGEGEDLALKVLPLIATLRTAHERRRIDDTVFNRTMTFLEHAVDASSLLYSAAGVEATDDEERPKNITQFDEVVKKMSEVPDEDPEDNALRKAI